MSLLQRYVLWELVKVFTALLSVLMVLLVFVGVIGEAAKSGLGPMQIIQILPFIVPSLLPFTIPATLLLTVCVVYGRLAGDQEITAVKAAGISVMALIWPSFFLGGVLSVATLVLTDQFIPWARSNIQRTITLAMEDIFLDILRTQNQLLDPSNGITITVMGVEGKTLLNPTFRYLPKGGDVVTIQAQRANLEFDLDKQEVVLHLLRGHIDTGQACIWFEREDKPFPLPREVKKTIARELTIRRIQQELVEVDQARESLEQRRALAVAIALSRGDFERFRHPDFLYYQALIDIQDERYAKLRTEVHSRFALSCSCLFFVILGSPVSILLARRQFLTCFFICFLPIILGYYPLTVFLCTSLAKKQGTLFDPAWTMWLGNGVLLAVGGAFLRRLLRN